LADGDSDKDYSHSGGDRHINGPPVLGVSYRLVVLDALALSDVSKNHILLRLPISRKQPRDRLPNHFAG
jgi:hypothetical protein